ncbi:MAG: response regulator transcription factor [Sinobacteraceae bacterium]|nr:response regulator transcription factor [Nevskiaceae bacterium]
MLEVDLAFLDIEMPGPGGFDVIEQIGVDNLVLRETIKQLAATLDPKRCVRIHRSAIVNIEHVKEVVRAGRCEGWVVLSGGQKVKMSQLGWQGLQATLGPDP